jgi:hypothetical protein
MPSVYHEEYEEGLETLGDAGLAFFKFFQSFTVKDTTIRYGKRMVDTSVSEETARDVKEYIREQKQWILLNKKSADRKELRRRMWWLSQKFLDVGVFSATEQHIISCWLDTCLDRTMEGLQMFITQAAAESTSA